MSVQIEHLSGQRSHSSNWGKFYVKGFSKEVKEEHDLNRRDKHQSFQCYVATCNDGDVFTVFDQEGDKRGTNSWTFSICVVDTTQPETLLQNTYTGFVKGQFRVIVTAEGKVKAPRLMDWWQKRPSHVTPLIWAEHCAAHIGKRGLAEPPPMA